MKEIADHLGGLFAHAWQQGKALSGGRSGFHVERYFQGWVEAGVRAIANGCASCGISISGPYRGRDSVPIRLPSAHPLVRLFTSINPDSTYFELITQTVTDLELSGNAYWLIVRGKLSRAPQEIYRLPPRYVHVVPGDRELVQGYLFRWATVQHFVPRADILHFRYSSPTSVHYGKGTVEHLLDAVVADACLTEAQRRTFENGPTPSAMLTMDVELTEAQITRLQTRFEERHAGPESAGKLMVAPKGTRFEPISTSPREMDYKATARSLRDRILGSLGVPPAILGMFDEAESATAMKAALEIFGRITLAPRLTLLASRITQDLCSAFLPDGLVAEFASPIPAERAEDRLDALAYTQAGILTPQEARQRYIR